MKIASILVIEDNLGDRKLISRFFDKHHVSDNVAFVSSIAEAKTIMARNLFDLLFIDASLTDGSGIEFAATLDNKKHDIVILSGSKATPETFLKAANNGAFMYIEKPLDEGDLNALIKEKARLSRAIAIRKIA